MKKQKQMMIPLLMNVTTPPEDSSTIESLSEASTDGAVKLLLSQEMCEATAQTYFAHFTSKLIHSQSNAIGVRVTPEYAKNIPYLCGARLLHDGTNLGLDYIAQLNAISGTKENSRNPHLLRVLERHRKVCCGKDVQAHPKDDYSGAEMYTEVIQKLPGGEIGDGLCPRCKQLILPFVKSEDDWEDQTKISYVTATPLSSGWINNYFFERFFERSSEITALKDRLGMLIETKKKTSDASERSALKNQIAEVNQSLEPHARFRDLQAVPWPVGGGNMQNVTGYYQRMAFSWPPEISTNDRSFFRILYGNRNYGEWANETVSKYLAWEQTYPESLRGDSLALDKEIASIFLPGIRQACLLAMRDHYACTNSEAFQDFLKKYRESNLPVGVKPFYADLVFGNFSHDFCAGLATQLVNRLEPKLREGTGFSEKLRIKFTNIFITVIKEFF